MIERRHNDAGNGDDRRLRDAWLTQALRMAVLCALLLACGGVTARWSSSIPVSGSDRGASVTSRDLAAKVIRPAALSINHEVAGRQHRTARVVSGPQDEGIAAAGLKLVRLPGISLPRVVVSSSLPTPFPTLRTRHPRDPPQANTRISL
jgi:hypothetical protein